MKYLGNIPPGKTTAISLKRSGVRQSTFKWRSYGKNLVLWPMRDLPSSGSSLSLSVEVRLPKAMHKPKMRFGKSMKLSEAVSFVGEVI